MATIKDFIKKIGNESVSLEEQQQALAQVEKTLVDAKAKREESIGKNVDLVISALKTIESKLEAKLAELNNTPSKQGVQGPVGKDGKDGLNGTDGRDGVSGKDGVDGKDGIDGQDGVSVTDAKIDFDGSLVVFLSNGNEIDCGQILSPDVAQNIIINSGGSGTSQSVTDTLASLQTQINTLTGIDGTLGTMAQQDATAVAITGGTINGTTIGATTPSTVNATTITGQTEVLNGTGTNLVLRSQALATSPWSASNLTVTNNSSTAPDGTSTATLLVPTVTNATHLNTQVSSTSVTANSIYTLSFYVKAAGYTAVTVANFPNAYLHYDLTNVVTSTLGTGWGAATITSVGSGWYRCTATSGVGQNWGTIYFGVDNAFVASGNSGFTSFAGDGTSGVYFWGVQLEQGTVANTYVPTTTTTIFGTATLSFQNAASISLSQFGALSLQPAGTGALQAQKTDSTATGGNARGANAVDWQTSRGSAGQVASATASVIAGGLSNTVSSFQSAIVGGNGSTVSNQNSFIGGGVGNSVSGAWSSIVGGNANTAAGYYNIIGGGWTNSGTSASAVTTQSGTMNATTAVTLSGSNASIKVGQYITGTSIAGQTYVAAISGTALTLSQNASGSSTSTLSFYTPHGVVVGGGNNQATGSYSFIGGGGDAGTAANRNVASGIWSFVGGGIKNTASGGGSVIAGGGTWDGSSIVGNTASGSGAVISGGSGNTNSSFLGVLAGGYNNNSTGSNGSVVSGGWNNTASGNYSTAIGGSYGTTRAIDGFYSFPTANPLNSATLGSTQAGLLVLGVETTNATATALRSNTSAAGTTNQVILPNNSAYFFTGEVVSGVTGGGNTKGWTIEGVIKRGANAASTALVGTPTVTSTYADVGAATWAIAVTADTTNGGIRVTFTGQLATTIRTVCQIRTTEMTY